MLSVSQHLSFNAQHICLSPTPHSVLLPTESHTGVVQQIDLRYTALKIKGEDGITLIPNSIVFSSVIGLQAKAHRVQVWRGVGVRRLKIASSVVNKCRAGPSI